MNSLRSIVSFLVLLAIPSNEMKSNNDTDNACAMKILGNDNHCINGSTCPTWFTCNAENRCQCDSKQTNEIVCDNLAQISAVLNCNCVTYDSEKNSTYVGACFYNCQQVNPSVYSVTKVLPKNPEMLINNSACTYFHRTGLLCGDCEEGYSPLVLSYNLSCVECPDGHKNWWKFILAGFMPLTAFYICMLAFNINVTSSRLHGVVWYSQAISMPVFIRIILFTFSVKDTKFLGAAKVGFVFYSVWNLDIFRTIIPNICLNVTTLQALAMEYLLALYPFILIIFSYLLLVLHDRRVVFVVTIWKPFSKALAAFRKSWDIHTSILDSFATFYLLSYNKILAVTADILIPTQIYQLGSNKSMLGLYYSPSVPYFGEEHLPYAVSALIMIALLACIPTTILILYPFKFFHNFLSLFPINWHFLHAFVDSFQGCYKDGTEPGTFDCRWFSIPMLLIWPLFHTIYSLSLSVMYFVHSGIIILILLIAMINFQPHKKVSSRYPLIDIIFTILLCFNYVTALGRNIAGTERYFTYHKYVTMTAFLTAIFPLFYISFLIGSWLFSKIKVCRSFH